MMIAYGEQLDVDLGCEQDNMSHTRLLRGLFLGEYFKNIF